jgi:hypothetical protein
LRTSSNSAEGADGKPNQATRGTIAAEPAPIDLDWDATALLIIDMQKYGTVSLPQEMPMAAPAE